MKCAWLGHDLVGVLAHIQADWGRTVVVQDAAFDAVWRHQQPGVVEVQVQHPFDLTAQCMRSNRIGRHL